MDRLDTSGIPDDYWPVALSDFASEKPLNTEHVVVAEISNPWGPDSEKNLYTGLVPKDRVTSLMNHRGCIGHEVLKSGPHPSSIRGKFNYEPDFWIQGADPDEVFEPLVVTWESVGKTVLVPDQGFLMTYGLVPRTLESGTIIWDDLENRVYEVVRIEPPAEYFYTLVKKTCVSIRREYLEDYATVRDMSMIQTYYVANSSARPDQVAHQLASAATGDVLLPQRMLCVRLDTSDSMRIEAEAWGFRHILDPSHAPVSNQSDYGNLEWPGYGAVDGSQGMRLHQLPPASKRVYVKDAVLGEYEGRPGFEISPESGAVSYSGHWSVGHTGRIGRDLIWVELKKLYEGNRPETVKTWHRYRVSPPDERFASRREQNIATRAKSVVYAMVGLGELLAEFASKTTGNHRTGRNLVKLDRAELDHSGWWKDPVVEPITRHAPLDMPKDDFMGRSVELFKVVEGLSEKYLRDTLIAIGIAEKDTKGVRSLALLERLVQLSIIAQGTGLDLAGNASEIECRRKERLDQDKESIPTPVSHLRCLAALRTSKSHREMDPKQALRDLGVSEEEMLPGWGKALDIVYDRTACALYDTLQALRAGMTG